MANDKLPQNIPEAEFIEKLFGDVTELSDEELDLLYEAATPAENASAAMYQLAEQAAAEYRKAGKVPPDHVQSVLRATRPQTSLEGSKASVLEKIVESIKAPFVGPVGDPSFSYRNRKDITDNDKTAIDELSSELNEDWEDDQK